MCPEALPNFARSLGQSCPTTSVTFVHRFGHAYSCTWVWMLMYMSKHAHERGQIFIRMIAFTTTEVA